MVSSVLALPSYSPFIFGFFSDHLCRKKIFPFLLLLILIHVAVSVPSHTNLDREPSLVDCPRLDTSQFHSFLASVEPTDNIDSAWANIFLTRCSKAFYWTLVQYGEGAWSPRVEGRVSRGNTLNARLRHSTLDPRHSLSASPIVPRSRAKARRRKRKSRSGSIRHTPLRPVCGEQIHQPLQSV